jgi:tripartite-type tricarboxylate transporter receptor subunit TctC
MTRSIPATVSNARYACRAARLSFDGATLGSFSVCLLACLLASPAAALEAVSFQGKTVSMIVGYAAGGGTDAFGRLAASFLTNALPGTPTVVVRNIPGAEGITAMNYFVQQVAPDGLTIASAANTAADPLNYRKPQSRYDPTSFEVIGGIGRGGTAIVISKEAEKRLVDRRAAPVAMGALGGVQRSGMLVTTWGIELLGWNAKWVLGYRGTSELMLALERGEIDMTATANQFLLGKLLESGRFKILVQTGSQKNGRLVPRADFGDAPILANLLDGKIGDPLTSRAFDYWGDIVSMDKWLALPPKSPPPVLETYREAFANMVRDPQFIDRGKAISDEFEPMTHEDVQALIRRLGRTSPQAVDYINDMLRRQGLEVQ